MPFRSQSQRKYLFAKHPGIAKEFASKTSKALMKKLPEHVGGNTMAKSKSKGKGKKAPLGEGGRFKALKKSLSMKGGIREPGALAAAIGRKKYGKGSFQALAAKGRKG